MFRTLKERESSSKELKDKVISVKKELNEETKQEFDDFKEEVKKEISEIKARLWCLLKYFVAIMRNSLIFLFVDKILAAIFLLMSRRLA